MRRTEGHFRGTHQLELFYQTWWAPKADSQSCGTLVVTHGLSEHSDCYNRFAERMNLKDWNIFGWDLRGHGRSEGKRGLVRSFEDYCLDLVAFLKYLEQTYEISKGPVVIFGHSLGGLITLRTAMDHDLNVNAMVLGSPLLGISMKVPVLKEFASKFLAKYFSEITLYNDISYEHLSRDPVLLKEFSKDPLRHEKISPVLFQGMLENMDYVLKNGKKVKLPLLMLLAGHDMIVSTDVAKNFFEQLPTKDKTLCVYEDAYHEIFNDLDYERAVTDLCKFLDRFMVKV